MNALHRDLAYLTERIEREDASGVLADPNRLHFHLMPPVGWLNDPNGLCFCNGWYHVFYQYSPFDAAGGVKHWGHYRSRDLLIWEKLPTFLYPDMPWDIHGVYSGSALVEDGVMYLYYTGNVKHAGAYDYIYSGRGHNTALAVCRDGITAQSKQLLMENRDYPANLSCHVRDPKVWRQDGKYYMVQGARTLEDVGELLVFESDNKFDWTYINTLTTPTAFGYMWECPDLFQIDDQWILLTSPQGIKRQGNNYQNVYSCGYFPLYGDFRGAYTLGDYVELDMGFDFYAPQTFMDHGTRTLIGWMGMPDAPYENPALGWQHCLTVPCTLTLQNGKLRRIPVSSLLALRGARVSAQDATIFDMEYTPKSDGTLVIRDSAVLKWKEGILALTLQSGGAGRTTRCATVDSVRSLRILADTTSLEIFVNEGEAVLSTRYYPAAGSRGVTLPIAENAQIWEMNALQIV